MRNGGNPPTERGMFQRERRAGASTERHGMDFQALAPVQATGYIPTLGFQETFPYL